MQLGPLEVGFVVAVVLAVYAAVRFAELSDAFGRTARGIRAGLSRARR